MKMSGKEIISLIKSQKLEDAELTICIPKDIYDDRMRPRKYTKLSKDELDILCKRYESGESLKDLCAETGANPTVVCHHHKQLIYRKVHDMRNTQIIREKLYS